MSANTETTGVSVGDVFERLTDIDSHRRAGSQFRIEEVDGEGAHWERRMYCLSPRFLLDETRYKRVTPPIAAPAAHVERRKGQRWKSVHRFSNGDVLTVVGTLAVRSGNDAWSLSDVERSDGIGAFDSCFADSLWSNPSETMTLLADAPPEPAKPSQLNCAKCGRSTDVCQFACTDRGACELTDCPCLAKSPPAQEAPKAAPLPFSFTDDENRVHRFATGIERDDASRAYGAWIAAQAGKPYAGPERLPRPQLAADWVEDCLPESGR